MVLAAPVAPNCCAASPPWSRHGAPRPHPLHGVSARPRPRAISLSAQLPLESLAREQDRLVLTFVFLSLGSISS